MSDKGERRKRKKRPIEAGASGKKKKQRDEYIGNRTRDEKLLGAAQGSQRPGETVIDFTAQFFIGFERACCEIL